MSTDAIANILELVGMEDLEVDVATACADDQDADPGVTLVAGAWTEDELTKLENVAKCLSKNPVMAVAAEQLLARVQEARQTA